MEHDQRADKALDSYAKTLGLSKFSKADKQHLDSLSASLHQQHRDAASQPNKPNTIVNHGSTMKKSESRDGWVSRGRAVAGSKEHQFLMLLRTTSSLSVAAWLGLADLYKSKQDFARAEVAYVGARYCDLNSKDVMRKWLAVYTINRGTSMSKSQILYEANIINQAMGDVISAPVDRLLHELQMLIFFLEREEVIDATDESITLMSQ